MIKTMDAIADRLDQMEGGRRRGRQRQTRQTRTLTESDISNIEKYWEKPECTLKYCWTHGSCGHSGKDCRKSWRARGHIESATFANRQGGSTRNMEKHSKLTTFS